MGGVHRDFSELLDNLGRDLCRQVPELCHIDIGGVLFALSRSRAGGRHGVYARIIPLRIAGGRRQFNRRRGRYRETWQMPEVQHEGRQIRYLIQVMVPRFFRLSRREKLATLVHELYHISEACDGDLRRFPGRNFAHGNSRIEFQRRVEALLDTYLAGRPEHALLDALDLDEESWRAGRVRVTGLRVPLPRARLIAREKL